MCGSWVLTLEQVPLLLGETRGPTIAFRWSEQMPVEPLVAFKRDANKASIYSWSRGIYHIIYIV